MLSHEENDLLTRVGPGTPMGSLMRRYWIPALLAEEIAEPDGPPVRVRLLGEDLVAFRDSRGAVGLLAEHCSHRGTSLFYGRNEECGLRCIYHGWKYDIHGAVLETPAEPPGSTLKDKVRHTAYPCKEIAGVVFAYMGPATLLPLFPNYEWTGLPPDQLYVTKSIQDCNYLQGLEGECDSSHLSFLHRAFTEEKRGGGDPDLYGRDGAPKLQAVETDFGVRMISCRNSGDGQTYLRVSNFVMPCHGFVPTGGLKGNPEGYTVHSHVPIDDQRSMRFNILFRRRRPVREEEKHHRHEIGPDYIKVRNLHNNYLQDREEQRRQTFTGMGRTFLVHDSCATESMGPICDRSKEHLGASDLAVIAVRKYLLRCLRMVAAGEDPPHIIRTPEQNDLSRIACIVAKLDSGTDPREHVAQVIDRETRAVS
ncbi:MAG TPA: Rieske 2Fe-2S domain-containing protein [Candidatus Eisenbacteria bacterium]|nr:Rieske 2Fe-2S domain-containing protein [Candidatus Eisenbacteria bacterium]